MRRRTKKEPVLTKIGSKTTRLGVVYAVYVDEDSILHYLEEDAGEYMEYFMVTSAGITKESKKEILSFCKDEYECESKEASLEAAKKHGIMCSDTLCLAERHMWPAVDEKYDEDRSWIPASQENVS